MYIAKTGFEEKSYTVENAVERYPENLAKNEVEN